MLSPKSLRVRAGLYILQQLLNWVDISLICATVSCFWHILCDTVLKLILVLRQWL